MAHRASLAPNVVGSAWTPWVRPAMATLRWAWAWAVMATWRAAAASITRSTACTSTTERAVSTTSLEVRP